MKNFSSLLPVCLFLSLVLSERGLAQAPVWGTTGNNVATGAFLGTLNNEPLIFKTNGIMQMRIKPDGGLVVKGFDNIGSGFVKFDNTGSFLPVPFNGSANEVLTANGSFQSIQVLSGWKPMPGNHFVNVNTGNIGIGVNTPSEKLHVVGNVLNDGFLLTRSISIVGTGQIGRGYPTEALEIHGNSRISGNSTVSGTISSADINTGTLKISSLSTTEAGSVLTANEAGEVIRADLQSMQQEMYKGTQLNYMCEGDVGASGLPVWLNKTPYIVYVAPFCSRVGIGNDDPQAKLDVTGTANFSDKVSIGTPSSLLPRAMLDVFGGPAWTTANWGKAMRIGNGQALELEAGTIKWGIGATSNGNGLYLFNTTAEDNTGVANYKMTILPNGNVGMGTTAPIATLNVVGTGLLVNDNNGTETFKVNNTDHKCYATSLDVTGTGLLVKDNSGTEAFKVNNIDHKCYAKEVVITLANPFPDYVFEKNYKLMPLEEVEKFVSENKHLPGVASAAEVSSGGLEIAKMQTMQMEKIEELTLYLIEQKKLIQQQQEQMQQMQQELNTLKAQVQPK